MWISLDSNNIHVDYLKTLLVEPFACFRLRFWAGFFAFLLSATRSGVRVMLCYLRDFQIVSPLFFLAGAQVCLSKGARGSVVG
jgi:hypothetical protein